MIYSYVQSWRRNLIQLIFEFLRRLHALIIMKRYVPKVQTVRNDVGLDPPFTLPIENVMALNVREFIRLDFK